MSYNLEVIFPPNSDPWFSEECIMQALHTSECVTRAFVFVNTNQGFSFWRNFADGENQEEGRAILKAFLNRTPIKLEDLI